MFVVLTNANEQHKGNKVAIKKDLIVSLHSKFVTKESGHIENVTYVFCPPHGTWEVSEFMEDVVDMINNSTK